MEVRIFHILTDDGGGQQEQRRTRTATAGDDDGRLCEIAIRPHTKSTRVCGKCRLLVTTHKHLSYILSYKLKNVGQILTVKTRGQLICLSSFGQQLLQGCLCKLMADSCRKMLAKRRQSGLTKATADDNESAADVPRQGVTLFVGGIGLPPSPTDHPPTGLHHIILGGHGGVSALPAHRRTLYHHQASCTNDTPAARRWRSCPSVDSYAGVKF